MSLHSFIIWQIDMLSFRLTQRLNSENAVIVASAKEHAGIVFALKRIRDNAPEQLTVKENIWRAWALEVLPTYNRSQFLFEVENNAIRRAAREKRDAALNTMLIDMPIGDNRG